jgi:hypothetical protein
LEEAGLDDVGTGSGSTRRHPDITFPHRGDSRFTPGRSHPVRLFGASAGAGIPWSR